MCCAKAKSTDQVPFVQCLRYALTECANLPSRKGAAHLPGDLTATSLIQIRKQEHTEDETKHRDAGVQGEA